MRWLVMVALVACTHHAAPPVEKQAPPPPAPDAAPIADAAPLDAAPDAAPPACPTTAAAVPVGTACSGVQACAYKDANCGCEQTGFCTGNVRAWKEAHDHPRYVWSCTLKVRPDGCPGEMPNRGWKCTKEGQVCEYAQCVSKTLACRSGKWQLEHESEPPP